MPNLRTLLCPIIWASFLIHSYLSSWFLVVAETGTARNVQLETSSTPFSAAILADTNGSHNLTTESQSSYHQALLYGILATTVVNSAALVGFVFAPFNKCAGYSLLISFMVATAVGSLFSAAILVLIPEAFQLMTTTNNGQRNSHWYILRSVSVCVGAALFFILEFLLRLLRTTLEYHSRDPRVLRRVSTRKRRSSLPVPYDGPNAPDQGDVALDIASPVLNVNGFNNLDIQVLAARKSTDLAGRSSSHQDSVVAHEGLDDEITPIHCCTKNLCHRLATLDPIVWMIVLGDGVHNFMDGVSMGAGFATEMRLGLSVSLAVLCEELPHELGDIAVLLRSGLSVPMAILFNFSSACSAYLGFFVGFYLGDMPNATVYIFAITGGFFLYISLADMLPELRKSEDQCMEQGQTVLPIFLIHFFGMVFGFGCVTAITMAGEYIAL
ncbi:Zinc transporter ZIP8 [Clonorchis sinensis]|uniref:Zinc transporter ZIP8 n=2 Tax=Clonorchis sinensis TaxID=79923 RepID=A0A8T1M7F4_CLOSI|nr:Zinc transporter ZIP8 [Clonorchis sinensis]GAA52448.1 zinc transporter ZIP14 [Clonorchis sinensis]